MSGSYNDLTRAIAIAFKGEYIVLRLEDTRELAVPMVWYPRLANATAKQRENWEWIGNGIAIHWPDIDEDLEVQGMLEGRKSPEYRKGIQNIGKWFEELSSKPQPANAQGIIIENKRKHAAKVKQDFENMQRPAKAAKKK